MQDALEYGVFVLPGLDQNFSGTTLSRLANRSTHNTYYSNASASMDLHLSGTTPASVIETRKRKEMTPTCEVAMVSRAPVLMR